MSAAEQHKRQSEILSHALKLSNLPKTLGTGDHHFQHESLADQSFQVYSLLLREVCLLPSQPNRHIASGFQLDPVSAVAYYTWIISIIKSKCLSNTRDIFKLQVS